MPFVIDVDRIALGRGAAWLRWLVRLPVADLRSEVLR
jgi:hypothetical protein